MRDRAFGPGLRGSQPVRADPSVVPREAPRENGASSPLPHGVFGGVNTATVGRSNIPFESPQLLLGFILGNAIPLLNLAGQVIRVALCDVQVVIGQLAPARLQFSAQLLPLSLDLVLVHCASPCLFLSMSPRPIPRCRSVEENVSTIHFRIRRPAGTLRDDRRRNGAAGVRRDIPRCRSRGARLRWSACANAAAAGRGCAPTAP